MKKSILILLFILIAACPCSAKENPKREVKKGNILYDEGKFKESLEHYEKASSADPNSGIVNYNIGTASYKLNDYERAVNFFNRALTDEEEELAQQTTYNLANSEYKMGISIEDSNTQEAVNLLTQSVRHYEKALELDKEDKDAIFNYEYVKKELKRLQDKLKQQQQEEKKNQESKDSDRGQNQEQKDQPQDQKEQQDQKDKEQQPQSEDEQDKQDQQQQGEDQKDQDGQEPQENDRERNVRGSVESSANGPQEEMSERQASMLLDNYHYDEEPKGLYKQKIDTRNMPDVDKDW